MSTPLLIADLPREITPDPFRPSHRAEGDIFHAMWCARCESCGTDREADPCMIAAMAETFDVDHEDYPKGWISTPRGPRCTAFVENVA